MELKVEREFQEKIPPLTEAEFEQLRENILKDGEVYEPIAVWNGIIVDGNNRWKIITEHPEIPYRIKEMPFADKWEAFEWMYKKQLGRRNLTDEQKTALVGKIALSRMQRHGGDRGNQYTKVASGQNGALAKADRTRDIIAKELGIGARSVDRAVQFAKGVDALREVSPEAADKVLSGKSDLSKQDVSAIAKMPAQEVEEVAQEINGDKPMKKVRFPTNKRGQHKVAEADTDFELTVSRDPDAVVEYTVADLLEEMRCQNADFIRKYKTMLKYHLKLMSDNSAEVHIVIDEVKKEIEKVEEAF